MDNPASYTHPALQQRSTPTIQSILAYGVSSSSLPPSPKHLQRHHPQNIAAITMPGAAPGLLAEPIASQSAPNDGQLSTISSEADFYKDDNTHPSGGESSTRRRNINSSKRAAQNRAAQRAFRLRRERYVAGLEEKARSYDRLEAAYMEMQRENIQLRSRLNKLYSENSILRNHLATGTHASSPSPPNVATAPFMPTQAPTAAPDRATHHAALRPPPPTHHQPESEYQYSTHQQPHTYHEHYHPRYHQRHHDHSPAIYQDNPQRPHGAFHRQSTVHRQPSPAGAQQPYHHNSVHRRHYPIRREHSLPQNTAGPRSPAPTERHLMRPEPIPPPSAFASPVERMSSPGGMWDGGMAAAVAAADRAQSPEVAPRPYNPQMSSETASSSSSAAAAHMLPSVRELTMSIGTMLPTSPHADHGLPAQPQFHAEGISSHRKSGCSETDRRPW
ncbi:hypothetical protein LPJ59_001785 [Coemansia sp. RSA 2399]|nr:hypothetical protein LPJ59_001785 [Coemansia sp. RSA 2399]KAJ1905907.1 hypothetical protein LPJ81_001662 [Coemansia sp. IMI 209127]